MFFANKSKIFQDICYTKYLYTKFKEVLHQLKKVRVISEEKLGHYNIFLLGT